MPIAGIGLVATFATGHDSNLLNSDLLCLVIVRDIEKSMKKLRFRWLFVIYLLECLIKINIHDKTNK